MELRAFFKTAKKSKILKDLGNEEGSLFWQALHDMNTARSRFDMATDPAMIDCAIFEEEAARKKVEYILKNVKEQEISL